MVEIQSVGMMGLGALGILFGQSLEKALPKKSVVVIADRDRQKRYLQEGITANGQRIPFSFVAPGENALPVDLLLFGVKYPQLQTAIQDAASQVGKNTIVLSLLNGVSSEETIGSVYGMEHLVYCVAQGMDATRVGTHLTYENAGQLLIGEADGTITPRLEALGHLFDKANIFYEIVPDIKRRLWSKFMLNTGVNQVAAVYQCHYRGLQEAGKARDTMLGAMEEAALVAQKKGIDLGPKDVEGWMKVLKTLSPEGQPSMEQDRAAGRPTEVDLFAGTVIRIGREFQVATPVNDWLYRQIKAFEEG